MSSVVASDLKIIEADAYIPTDPHLDGLLELQASVNAALAHIDVFSSVDHTQGLAQHALASIKLKLGRLIDEYRQPQETNFA